MSSTSLPRWSSLRPVHAHAGDIDGGDLQPQFHHQQVRTDHRFRQPGAFDLGVVKLAVLALPLILGALWLGIRVRKRVDMATYRGMLRGSLWVISVAILLDALRRMVVD